MNLIKTIYCIIYYMVNTNKIIDDDINLILHSDFPWNELSEKSFLISGANGVLPRYIVFTILQQNRKNTKKSKVIALVKNKKHAEQVFHQYLADPCLKLIENDLTNEIELDEKIDFIIHAASYANPKHFSIDPIGTLLPNTIGTKNMLDLARKKNVQSFLFFSSSEIYGQISDELITESSVGWVDPLDLRSCYAESKRMGENMCISWFKQYEIPVKIARIFHTYGPGIKLDDGRVFADFVSNVVNNHDIVIKSDGTAKRSFCYIVDATLAFFTILLKGKNGDAYNVANPDCYVTILELAKKISSLFPEKKLKVIFDKQSIDDEYIKSKIYLQNPDITKITKLGWTPKFSIEMGFTRTIMSYIKND